MTVQSSLPEHECDLVMQGAVASGVVYPPVILKLKDYYRFRNIGGTSAGAIAAAGAAAAEFGREKGGFDHLKAMSDWLGGYKNLRNLFQPSPDTKPLMNLVDAIFPRYTAPQNVQQMQQMGSRQSTFQSVRQFADRLMRIWESDSPRVSWGALWGTIPGFVLFALLPLAAFGIISLFLPEPLYVSIFKLALLLVFGGVGAWLGSKVAWVAIQIAGVISAIIKLPGNFYGICTGLSNDPNVLINWLSDQLNEVAGLKKDEPLTFGHLKTKPCQSGQDACITLRMITSNLSQGRPYILPTGLKGFLFKKDDMDKLFPSYIVEHMIASSAKVQNPIVRPDQLRLLSEKEGFYFFPNEDDLPVVVAMRLSLSFPILLSAIPLYTIKPSAIAALDPNSDKRLRECDMQKNWFSDGGICDNFPIEFFDDWLSTRPTFGISLTSMPTKQFVGAPGQRAFEEVSGPSGTTMKQISQHVFSAPTPDDKSRLPDDTLDVYLPRADAPPTSKWQQLEGILAFLSAILSTGLGWYRTLQTELPSYRDRIVQIRLDEAEGGLHLNMPQEVIKTLVTKGGQAGDLLIPANVPGDNPDKFNFAHHEWVRYRVLMAKLEENFQEMQETLQDSTLSQPLNQPFENYSQYPYPPPDDKWLRDADTRLQALKGLLGKWRAKRPDLFSKDEPQPETVLRVTPDV
ncbi:MAG TPA: patatin-like phospholipase family protein [Ktedonobacteraceae bacterium]|nr:patatin-like phospholipase family protein [Ktedonobacteraceae bacterium]